MGKNEIRSLDLDIINFIIKNNNATIEELSNYFDVSQVNIRNILNRIENFIEHNNLGTLLKENGKYFLKNNFINLNFNYKEFQATDIEKRERIAYIILKLVLDQSINLTQISRELNISRVTLNGDIEFIKEFLNGFNLKLISVQWKGIFLEGDFFMVKKFSILYIAKLYIEGYFSYSLKKIVNPLILETFRTYVDIETEKKISNIANKLYHLFKLQLGITYYVFLKCILIFLYIEKSKSLCSSANIKAEPTVDLTEKINNSLTEDERNLLGDTLLLLNLYLSQCIYDIYTPIYSFSIKEIIDEFFKFFNLKENDEIARELALFLNSIYFENKFSVPTYVIIDEEELKCLESDISLSIIDILTKYNIPFKKENIIFLHMFITELISESQRENVLIIDTGSLHWKGKRLKEKIKHLSKFNHIDIISYFNFKFYNNNDEKTEYQTYIFIDLPFEKTNIYPDKKCYFINGYDLIKNNIDFTTFFS